MSIQVEGLSKRYRRGLVLDDVSFTVPDGSIVGLSGVNGSGKTMVMRAVCGLIHPTAGTVSIDGRRLGIDADHPGSMGALIEAPAFLDWLTGAANLEIIARIAGVVGMEGVRAALEMVGLDPDDPRRYREYSLGMRQRLGIAAAIMEEPRNVVLDEPTNALDTEGVDMVDRVVRGLKGRGCAVLISCHDAPFLDRIADSVHHIEGGRIVKTVERGRVNDAQVA